MTPDLLDDLPERVSRREILAVLLGVATLSTGCTGSGDDPGNSDSGEDDQTEEGSTGSNGGGTNAHNIEISNYPENLPEPTQSGKANLKTYYTNIREMKQSLTADLWSELSESYVSHVDSGQGINDTDNTISPTVIDLLGGVDAVDEIASINQQQSKYHLIQGPEKNQINFSDLQSNGTRDGFETYSGEVNPVYEIALGYDGENILVTTLRNAEEGANPEELQFDPESELNKMIATINGQRQSLADSNSGIADFRSEIQNSLWEEVFITGGGELFLFRGIGSVGQGFAYSARGPGGSVEKEYSNLENLYSDMERGMGFSVSTSGTAEQ